MRLSFGCCVLDTETRELTVGSSPAHVTPRMLQLLEVLLESRPRAVSKDELHARIWLGTFVSDATLSGLVAEVRKVIGDDAREPNLIRTAHRYGYAFSGQVSVLPTQLDVRSAAFRLLWGPREIALRDGENLIGRMREAMLWIDDPSVSRRHARIVLRERAALIEDLGSKNGTLLNGCRLDTARALADGDTIGVGPATLAFRVYSADGSTQTRFRP